MFLSSRKLNKYVIKLLQKMVERNSIAYQYKTQEMCDEAVHNYPHALGFVPECYKTQEMYDEAVNTYLSVIQFVPDRFKTKEMCDKAVYTCPLVFDSVHD